MTSIKSFRSNEETPKGMLFGELEPHITMKSGGELYVSSVPGAHRHLFPEIIGRSLVMQSTLDTVAKIAKSEGAVLIHGESGTGKELIAAAIHRLSLRAHKKFVAINCSAIPEALLESELFGHEKGAFTGAVGRRIGHFEMASGGTLFLDEIGDMPLRLQAKLLRVLQEKSYCPVGSNEQKIADVRIVAASNIDLEKAVGKSEFRLDLFYRLNVLPVMVPALRDRKEDVQELLEHFLALANRNHRIQSPCYFSADFYQMIAHYDWPGNVRELQNLVERLVVLAGGGIISASHLSQEYKEARNIPNRKIEETEAQLKAVSNTHGNEPISVRSVLTLGRSNESVKTPADFSRLPEEGLDLTTFIEELENSFIIQALERTGNNRNQAAKLLGLNRTTLVERIKKRRILNSESYFDIIDRDLPFKGS